MVSKHIHRGKRLGRGSKVKMQKPKVEFERRELLMFMYEY